MMLFLRVSDICQHGFVSSDEIPGQITAACLAHLALTMTATPPELSIPGTSSYCVQNCDTVETSTRCTRETMAFYSVSGHGGGGIAIGGPGARSGATAVGPDLCPGARSGQQHGPRREGDGEN